MPLLKFAVLENINLAWFIFWLVVGTLASWRLTNIAHWEKIFTPVRKLFGIKEIPIINKDGNIVDTKFIYPDTFFGKLWSCFWCLSVWVSLGVTIVILVFPWVLLPFAISAVAIIIEKAWE